MPKPIGPAQNESLLVMNIAFTLAGKSHPHRPFLPPLPRIAALTAPWSPPQTVHQALCLYSRGQICCAGLKKKEKSETGISFPVTFLGLATTLVQLVILLLNILFGLSLKLLPLRLQLKLELFSLPYHVINSRMLKKTGILLNPEEKNTFNMFFLKTYLFLKLLKGKFQLHIQKS